MKDVLNNKPKQNENDKSRLKREAPHISSE